MKKTLILLFVTLFSAGQIVTSDCGCAYAPTKKRTRTRDSRSYPIKRSRDFRGEEPERQKQRTLDYCSQCQMEQCCCNRAKLYRYDME